MDERSALRRLAAALPAAGDDAAVVDGLVVTTDMLHESTDFPSGTTRYTAGWRAVGASLSDVAAMGADATAAVAAYAAPTLDESELDAFLDGAIDVCEAVDARYVGGDLDTTGEFTVATTALGETDAPVLRSGANVGDVVCVTGALGRTAAALRAFDAGESGRGNDLFRFAPRVASGVALAPHATAMMDSSDGLARSLHQLAEASDVGFEVSWDAVPVHDAVDDYAGDDADRRAMATTVGEDFELVCTLPADAVDGARDALSVPLTVIGDVVDGGVRMDGELLADEGYTHE
ncbi:thiamine-phosphate kinase [Halobellus limi]|jgi:thiamine-monophosphate kinase|uniref:Thiamine-monophosphate kinase n=1 Tax=Halobellus limi TaxID=699433 RepID=A0A1H6CLR1_9EURY|nr:thiamine-phosphate kinase [Halobellus limi]QCC48766.1 thiamine-phosphate kinase [Halobellus limi]SEG73633.1 thiamine-monophosphate kinase [Halobellus limi]